jgi:hypothetical protein
MQIGLSSEDCVRLCDAAKKLDHLNPPVDGHFASFDLRSTIMEGVRQIEQMNYAKDDGVAWPSDHSDARAARMAEAAAKADIADIVA